MKPQISSKRAATRTSSRRPRPTATPAGFVYSPRWAEGSTWSDGLSFELTYFNIELEKAIAALDAQVQINGCAETLDPVTRSGIRDAGRRHQQLRQSAPQYRRGIDTDGWDFNIRWLAPAFRGGRFGVLWQTNKLDEYTEITPTSTGFQKVKLVGTETGDLGAAYPEWKSNLTVDWSLADWAASVSARYIESVFDSNARVDLASKTYVDMQVTWTPSQFMDGSWAITFGANNLFDEDPPPCNSCALNGFDPSAYDTPGILVYARVVAHFGRD